MSFFNDVEPTIISEHQKQPKTTLDLTVYGLPRSALTKVKYEYESYKSDKGQLCSWLFEIRKYWLHVACAQTTPPHYISKN